MAYMIDDTTEGVAEQSSRLQPSINLHAAVTALMISCSGIHVPPRRDEGRSTVQPIEPRRILTPTRHDDNNDDDYANDYDDDDDYYDDDYNYDDKYDDDDEDYDDDYNDDDDYDDDDNDFVDDDRLRQRLNIVTDFIIKSKRLV